MACSPGGPAAEAYPPLLRIPVLLRRGLRRLLRRRRVRRPLRPAALEQVEERHHLDPVEEVVRDAEDRVPVGEPPEAPAPLDGRPEEEGARLLLRVLARLARADGDGEPGRR